MSKINWKLRLKNPATLLSLIALTVSFIYSVLGLFGVVPTVSEDEIMNLVTVAIQILVAIGVIVDPTTAGVSDSDQALTYDSPRAD